MGSDLYERAHFRIEGDRYLLIEYGEVIDPAVSQKVRFMAIVVKNNKPDGVIDIIPICLAILMFYDSSVITPSAL